MFYKIKIIYIKVKDKNLEKFNNGVFQILLNPCPFTLFRYVKVTVGSYELGWTWVNLIRFILSWARNFVIQFNLPRMGGLSGLAHQLT